MQPPVIRHDRRHQVVEAVGKANDSLDETARRRKFARMGESPYRFFRGTNHLYWRDFYGDWRFALFGGRPETVTWLQGDAHVYNFGAFGDHYGRVIYGMDDFDDSVVGDYQYDLWRLAISVVLDCRTQGFGAGKQRKALVTLAEAYLAAVGDHADGANPPTANIETTDGELHDFLEKVARKRSRARMLEKWTHEHPRRGRMLATSSSKKLEALDPGTRRRLRAALERYRGTLAGRHEDTPETHFRIKDVARRLGAGTGSLGSERYYALIEGASQGEHDDVILDIKEQTTPEAWNVMPAGEQREYAVAFAHEGERHASAFRAIASHPDAYLGWLQMHGRVFSVRERSPFKDDFPTHKLTKGKQYRAMAAWWGRVLAWEHVRGSHALSPDDPTVFAQAITRATDGDRRDAFLRTLEALAFAYADQTRQDHAWFVEAFAAARDDAPAAAATGTG